MSKKTKPFAAEAQRYKRKGKAKTEKSEVLMLF
jgi:hypothetical protein